MIDNTRYLLAFNRINGAGPRTILKCLAKQPNLATLFELSVNELITFGLPQKIAIDLANFNLNSIDIDFEWQTKPNNKIITWGDSDYPALLKEIHDPPMVLYLKGNLACLKKLAIAIVGTRKPSINGYENAAKFAYELAIRNFSVISGLAIGVDTEVHLGCLNAKGSTIAVMGTGIDCIYPRRNSNLASKIEQNGLLISEFPLKTSPIAGHFPRRNRIISGLSLATLVVEAAIKSGSLITARLALEQNRDVFAIPGSIHNPQAKGCHKLLQEGAKLITSVDDILDEMNLYPDLVEKIVSKELVTCENKKLLKYIGFEVTSVDQMISRSGLEVCDIICDLAELELDGIIGAVPGGYMRYK